MSGSLSTEGSSDQGRLVAMVPDGLFRCLTSQPCMGPANKDSVLGSYVLCCDGYKLLGSLGSYITSVPNSEPITPFPCRMFRKLKRKKVCKLDLVFFFLLDRPFLCSFLPFVPKQTLVIFRSCLRYSEGKTLDFLNYREHYPIIVFPLIWLPFLRMNLPIFSLSVVFSSPVSVHCICISFSYAHSFHSLVFVYFVWESQSKNTPKTPYTQTLDFSWATSQRAFYWV